MMRAKLIEQVFVEAELMALVIDKGEASFDVGTCGYITVKVSAGTMEQLITAMDADKLTFDVEIGRRGRVEISD